MNWDYMLQEGCKILSPRIFHTDETSRTLYYEWIEGAKPLQSVLSEEKPIEEVTQLISRAAIILASIHSLPISGKIDPLSPSLDQDIYSPLLAIEKSEYANCTGAELEFFSLLQHDQDLIEALSKNNRRETSFKTIYGMRHGDIRLDQFLLDLDNNIWIIDFEEFSYGNIFTDLSGLLGSLFFDVTLRTFSSGIPDVTEAAAIDEAFVKRGEANFNYCKPILINAFKAYQNAIPYKIDNQLVSLGIGWFIIERIMSRAKYSYRLSAIDKAIAGIGRQIILAPDLISEIFNN